MSVFPSFPSNDPDLNILPPGISPFQDPEFSWTTPLALPETQSFRTSTPASRWSTVAVESHFLNGNNAPHPGKEHDIKELIIELRVLIAEANKAANDVLDLMKLKHKALRRICVADTAENHRLKQVTGPPVDVKSNFDANDKHSKATKIFGDLYESLKSKKDPTNSFFYSDSPGVVQMHIHVDGLNNGKISLPDFAAGELWAELMRPDAREEYAFVDETRFKSFFIPSRLWSLEKDIDAWRDFPSNSNLTLLKVAWALKRVKIRDLKRFLHNHLSSYALESYRTKLDYALYLIIFCLRAVQRKAAESTWKYGRNQMICENTTGNRQGFCLESENIEFSVLLDSANWLSSHLSPLCSPAASKGLVLHSYKHAFKCAVRSFLPVAQSTDLCSNNLSQLGSFISEIERSPKDLRNSFCEIDGNVGRKDSFANPDAISDEGESLFKSDSSNADEDNVEKKIEFQNFPLDNRDINQICFVGDVVLSLYGLATAAIVLRDLQDSKKRIESDHDFFQSPPYHRLHLSNMMVEKAEELRAARVNYRAVLEFDGLIWQTPQNQELNRNKTKEEILAEERDYKRRRMSYRGKNVKRTPVQVLRDIITGHMQDIVASGGIGCFGRKVLDMPPLSKSLQTVDSTKDRTEKFYTKDTDHSEHSCGRQRDHHKGSHASNAKSYRSNTISSRWEGRSEKF